MTKQSYLLIALILCILSILFIRNSTFLSKNQYTSTDPLSETTTLPIQNTENIDIQIGSSTESSHNTPLSTSSASTTISQSKTIQPKASSVATTSIAIQSTISPSQKPIPVQKPVNFELINTESRKALVNIICTTKAGGDLSPITATGVIIDSQGTILTNAHVGQYWLLQNFISKKFVECTIRTGSPAYPRYKAELVYISSKWVEKNKTLLKETNPQGTGENDFALLRITGSLDNSPLPIFSYIEPSTREILPKNEQVLLISYPAGFLGGLSVLQDLSLTSAIATIKDIFTFTANTEDLISVPNTIVSQKGASGGAVVDSNSKLVGIITTSTDAVTTSDRDLRAITVGHIKRVFEDETNIPFSTFLSQDIAAFAKTFQSTEAPVLSKLIETELLK